MLFTRLLWRRELQTSYIWQCKWTSLLIFTVSTFSTLYTCREPRGINSLTARASEHFPSNDSLKVFRRYRTVEIHFVCNWLGCEMSGSLGSVWRNLCYRHFGGMFPVICEIRDTRIPESLFQVITWLYIHISMLKTGSILLRNFYLTNYIYK